MTDRQPHTPVLLDEIVGLLAAAPDGVIVDATLGAAGHASAVIDARLAQYGSAHLVGLDQDPHALALAESTLARFADNPAVRIDLVRTRFDALERVLGDLGVNQISGILFDLGISSMHVDEADRGFSYRQHGPLDMRMDPDLPISAAELVNDLPVGELAGLLKRYADEKFAGRIARAIKDTGEVTTTTQLAEIVRDAIPHAARRTGGHPATRTFQALRIAVNDELAALERLLPAAIDRLGIGGVAASLAYHSLEDRLVKRAFAEAASGCTCPPSLPVCACGKTPRVAHLIRKPVRPSAEEAAANPRASAAKLRAVRKITEERS